jgi:hypothetical protein
MAIGILLSILVASGDGSLVLPLNATRFISILLDILPADTAKWIGPQWEQLLQEEEKEGVKEGVHLRGTMTVSRSDIPNLGMHR